MRFWWNFGGVLVAIWRQFSRLRFTSTGNTRTATKLPPHHHQLSTKMPPNLPNGHRNDGTETKKAPRFHWVCSKTLPLLKQNSKSTHFSTFLLPLRLKILFVGWRVLSIWYVAFIFMASMLLALQHAHFVAIWFGTCLMRMFAMDALYHFLWFVFQQILPCVQHALTHSYTYLQHKLRAYV